MVPTLIVAGLVVGRWWVILIATIAWPAVLTAMQGGSGLRFVIGAASVALLNTAGGVLAHKGMVGFYYAIRDRVR